MILVREHGCKVIRFPMERVRKSKDDSLISKRRTRSFLDFVKQVSGLYHEGLLSLEQAHAAIESFLLNNKERES